MNELVVPDDAQIREQLAPATALELEAADIVVCDQEGLDLAGDLLRRIQTLKKNAEAWFKGLKRPLDDAKKQVLDKEKQVLAPLDRAREIVDRRVSDFQLAERRRLEEEARKAREEAERKAREEQARKAAELAARGREDLAEKVMERPISVAPIAPQVPPQTAGIGQARTLWRFAVDHPEKLPREFMVPDMARIQGVVNALHERAAETIPGISVWSEQGKVSVRSY